MNYLNLSILSHKNGSNEYKMEYNSKFKSNNLFTLMSQPFYQENIKLMLKILIHFIHEHLISCFTIL